MTDTAKSLIHLDETVGKLESMGRILELLATTEAEEPDLTSLADLGRIIQSLATESLEIISEMEFSARESTNDEQAKESVAVEALQDS